MADWLQLGTRAPVDLGDDRLDLHYAAWILGSVADSVLPTQADDSQSNLGYEPDEARFATRVLGDEVRMTIGLVDLELRLWTGTAELAGFDLTGETFEAGLAWADRVVDEHLPGLGPVRRREYPDFPPSPLADGAPFGPGDREVRLELGRYFGNALLLLDALAARESALSEVRIWPHHFDFGALLQLDEERMIGLGMSPGDGSFAEPYLYVYPYPYPPSDRLPDLGDIGRWHAEGFTAAVLTGSDLVSGGDQQAMAASFLQRSVTACREVLA